MSHEIKLQWWQWGNELTLGKRQEAKWYYDNDMVNETTFWYDFYTYIL